MKKFLLLLFFGSFTFFAGAETWFAETCIGYMKIENYPKAIGCFEWGIANADVSSLEKDIMKALTQQAYYYIGVEYYDKKDYNYALGHFQKAYSYAIKDEDRDLMLFHIDMAKTRIQEEEDKKNAPSNDPLSYLQYYLKTLNVPQAWNKVTNNKPVIVALIDDGININHPDLTGKVWTSPSAKYGSSKIIDFVGDNLPSNLPAGEHGTMIAGIIGATINNKEGIAGIAKNVSFMPLRVFDTEGNAEESSLIKALNYAIDNGANIINLSLGLSQFTYSEKYDAIIKKAYDKGVLVVIAAGNGDILSSQDQKIDLSTLAGSILDLPVSGANGVNLTDNPVSPVCNNGGKNNKYSIGVHASDRKGYKAGWSNYGDCAPFMAPGANIVSSSIPIYNDSLRTIFGKDYNIASGTSFSAPMITGIIALGYNQYGFVRPEVIYSSLMESLVSNGVGNYIVDAAKYLDILGSKASLISKDQKNNTKQKDATESLQNTESIGDTLADLGIVTKKNSEKEYRLNDPVLRQEVIGMAVKILGKVISDDYVCQNYFTDVSSKKPNNWICKSLELAADYDLVSRKNSQFRPSAKITRAEALSILLKAAGMKTGDASLVSSFTDVTVEWQIQVTNVASETGVIDLVDKFRPNAFATRGEIFEMARRILTNKA